FAYPFYLIISEKTGLAMEKSFSIPALFCVSPILRQTPQSHPYKQDHSSLPSGQIPEGFFLSIWMGQGRPGYSCQVQCPICGRRDLPQPAAYLLLRAGTPSAEDSV